MLVVQATVVCVSLHGRTVWHRLHTGSIEKHFSFTLILQSSPFTHNPTRRDELPVTLREQPDTMARVTHTHNRLCRWNEQECQLGIG